ncbi:hypothetical protein D3272_15840 [Lichenibacterium ramalinae]|uniref:Uncharacterized protein n=1 Tax=Lichenibacterium ramalinae TaxID=2316527 RepID=A0A4Q2RA56_9HYPH|nr:hypothetical protein D3272_15840 [Lichenibacterium ramalinae]
MVDDTAGVIPHITRKIVPVAVRQFSRSKIREERLSDINSFVQAIEVISDFIAMKPIRVADIEII